MSTPISELNQRLPVDTLTDAVGGLAETLTDTVHRVGQLVGDHVPDSVPPAVHEAVAEGVTRSRRILSRSPLRVGTSARRTSRVPVVLIVGSALAALGAAVIAARRARRRREVAAALDDWTVTGAERDVA